MDLKVEYFLIEFEEETEDEMDYSQMRIPLILISFGFVIYISVRRNKVNPEE